MLAIVPASAGHAQTPADFYRGKTVEIVIGYSVGGGYDIYARLIARHLGKHIPGNPKVVPKNMEGAGGMRIANWLYGAAPQDGTVIGAISRAMAFEPLLGNKAAQYDADQGHLYRQRQRRGQRLHGLAHVRRHDASRTCRRANSWSAPAASPTTPINSRRSSTTCSAPSSRW